jgi:hypothetical protein
MVAMIDTGKPHHSHPEYWVQFVVVGEGRCSPPRGHQSTREGLDHRKAF